MLSKRLSLVAALSLAGCSATGPYVWADSLPQTATGSNDAVIIHDGDVVNVRVMGHEEASTHEKVRPDGKISLPLVGEVMARGKKPAQLAAELQNSFKASFVSPTVTVNLDAGNELKVSVVGEVKQSGSFPLEHGATVLHALAAAGGLSEYADSDKVFVVRRSLPQRVRFRYSDLRSGEPRSIGFTLQAGDVVVVE